MRFFNHYSAPIVVALLLAIGLSVVLRRGNQTRDWVIFGGVSAALVVVWLLMRPVAHPVGPGAGQPVLLEVQSPYCLGCVAIKPAVDRLENESRGKLRVQRVDIQSAEGQKLVSFYGIEFTPTFILFDSAGKEQWRSVGRLDTARVRAACGTTR